MSSFPDRAKPINALSIGAVLGISSLDDAVQEHQLTLKGFKLCVLIQFSPEVEQYRHFREVRNEFVHGVDHGEVWSVMVVKHWAAISSCLERTFADLCINLNDEKTIALLFFQHLLDLCREHMYDPFLKHLYHLRAERQVPEQQTQEFRDYLTAHNLDVQALVQRVEALEYNDVAFGGALSLHDSKMLNMLRNYIVFDIFKFPSRSLKHQTLSGQLNEHFVIATSFEQCARGYEKLIERHSTWKTEEENIRMFDCKVDELKNCKSTFLLTMGGLLHSLNNVKYKPTHLQPGDTPGDMNAVIYNLRATVINIPELLMLPDAILGFEQVELVKKDRAWNALLNNDLVRINKEVGVWTFCLICQRLSNHNNASRTSVLKTSVDTISSHDDQQFFI